jgi:hypothetical protein
MVVQRARHDVAAEVPGLKHLHSFGPSRAPVISREYLGTMRPSCPKGLHCCTHFCSSDGMKPTSMAPAKQNRMNPPNVAATIKLRRTAGRSFMLHNVRAQRAAKPSAAAKGYPRTSRTSSSNQTSSTPGDNSTRHPGGRDRYGMSSGTCSFRWVTCIGEKKSGSSDRSPAQMYQPHVPFPGVCRSA